MKVIEEIISYLHARGSISKEQFEYLEREGFYRREGRRSEEENYYALGLESDWALSDPYELEQCEQDRITARQLTAEKRRRNRTRSIKTGKRQSPRVNGYADVLRAPELRAWLAERMPTWEKPLSPIAEIARRISEKAIYQSMPQTIRNLGTEDLIEVIVRSLSTRTLSLGALSDAVGFDAYRWLESNSQAARAFDVILASANSAQMGKYAWVLREPEVCWVYNLAQAQKQLAAACRRIYESQPELIAKSLREFRWNEYPIAYLTFVILYTADRFDPDKKQLQRAGETPSHAAPTSTSAVMKAWKRAWQMNFAQVFPLFSYHVAQQLHLKWRQFNYEEQLLFCPKEWRSR